MPTDRMEIVLELVDRFSPQIKEFQRRSAQAAKTVQKSMGAAFKKIGRVFAGVFNRIKKTLTLGAERGF